jgi:hypothetical protein
MSALMVCIVATMLCGAAFAVDPPLPPTPISTVVEGLITAIAVATPTSAKITVAPVPLAAGAPTPAPVTFIVNSKTQLFKDGKVCLLPAILVGDSCRALLVKNAEGGLVAQIVYARTVVPPIKVDKGTIFDKGVIGGLRTFKLRLPATATLPEVTAWFSVSDRTKITVDGKPASYDLLANGQFAEVGFLPPPPGPLTVTQPILASSVAAKNPPPPPVIHVIGRLISVDLVNGIIVVNLRGTTTQIAFKITDATKIDKFGPAPLAALVPAGVFERYLGDMVDVASRLTPSFSAVPPVAISVVVLPDSVMGVIAGIAINPDGVTGTLQIGPKLATNIVLPSEQYKVVPATRITRNGMLVTIGQLVNGDLASLKFFQFREGKVASLVEARTSTLPPSPLP